MFNLLAHYSFFMDKYTLREMGYDGQDKMSIKQFIVMGLIFIIIILISLLFKKRKEKLYLVYKILSIVMPILEIIKISFETHYDFLHGETFNYGGILPFYTCSMLMYFLPFIAFTKGKMKEYSMAFFTTIGLVAGLSNFVYLSAAGWYPLHTFGCIHSILYHSAIVFVGMSLMITGIYKPTLKTMLNGMIPVLIFSAFVLPINYIIKNHTNDTWVDYMLLMDGNGFPIIGDFANLLKEKGIHLVFSLIMLFILYPIATILISLIDIGIIKLVTIGKKEREENES